MLTKESSGEKQIQESEGDDQIFQKAKEVEEEDEGVIDIDIATSQDLIDEDSLLQSQLMKREEEEERFK